MPTQSTQRVRSRHPWILAGLATLLAGATLAPGARASSGPNVAPPKAGTTWLGTYEEATGTQAERQSRLLELESSIGRKVDLDHTYKGWSSSFPGWREEWDTANGRVPFVSWGKTSTSAINSGRYDGLIRSRAAEVKAAGYPILLEWFWEMDGSYNKYLAGTPASFISAWKRIHDIFDKAGVTNVSWVWCPNAWGFATGAAQKFYPGDGYVDWICANGYNWAPGRNGDDWRPFQQIFQPFYDWAAGHGKPLMVGEFGVQERHYGEKAQWLKEAAVTLRDDFPAIKAAVYFNVQKLYDWRIASSTSARRAFRVMAETLR